MIFIVSSCLFSELFSNFMNEFCCECVVAQFPLWFLQMICDNLLSFFVFVSGFFLLTGANVWLKKLKRRVSNKYKWNVT